MHICWAYAADVVFRQILCIDMDIEMRRKCPLNVISKYTGFLITALAFIS